MFQITPEYPASVRRWLAPMIAVALLLWSFRQWWPPLSLAVWLLPAGLVLFAGQTLRLQARRRRKLADVTLDFWRLAMVSLLLSVLAWVGAQFFPGTTAELMTGLLFFVGFAISAVNGMLYKIVPFLVWLHLNNRLQQAGQWQGKVPNMKQVIPERHARWQFRLHVAALVLLVAGLLIPIVPVQPGAVLWLLSSLALGWNLVGALRLYLRIPKESREAVT
jgi:hypothetical protein